MYTGSICQCLTEVGVKDLVPFFSEAVAMGHHNDVTPWGSLEICQMFLSMRRAFFFADRQCECMYVNSFIDTDTDTSTCMGYPMCKLV